MTSNKVTIIAPIYLSNPKLTKITQELFLRSVSRLEGKDQLEVILVDDASPMSVDLDKMVYDARQNGANVKILQNPSNLGFAGSIQRGANEAQTRYITVANNDIYLSKDSIVRMLSILSSDSRIGAIGPTSNRAFNYWAQERKGIKLSLEDEQIGQKIEEIAQRVAADNQGLLDVNWLTGFCMVMPTQEFMKVGGMDNSYGLGYHDESDLCVRLKKDDKHLVVDTGSFVYHVPSPAFFFGSSMYSVFGKTLKSFLFNFRTFAARNGVGKTVQLIAEYKFRKNFPVYNTTENSNTK
jgi:GT2 family glycosyltransferase